MIYKCFIRILLTFAYDSPRKRGGGEGRGWGVGCGWGCVLGLGGGVGRGWWEGVMGVVRRWGG